MSLKDVQKDTAAFISQYEDGYWEPRDQIVCLAEEVGELAREVNHRFGPKKRKDGEDDGNLAREMADIIFIISCLANRLEIDLDDAWQQTVHKYSTRDATRFKRKE